MDLINKIILLLSGQGLVLSYLIFKKHPDSTNRKISLYILIFSGILIYWYFAYWDANQGAIIKLFRADLVLHLFLGPLLYTIVRPKIRIKNHLILPLICLPIFVYLWITVYNEAARTSGDGPMYIDFTAYFYQNILGVGLCTLYALLAARHVRTKLQKLLLAALMIYVIGWLANHAMFLMKNFISSIDYFIVMLEIIIFYGAGYYTLIELKKDKKYEVKDDQLQKYMPKISALMAEEKPYLDSGFSIKEMADQLSIHHRKLSQILNQGFKQSFTEYINSYRIEEAKTLLLKEDYEKHTVLEILMECGFNSKSAFNAAFKKFTGQSPLEFRKAAVTS